MSEPHIVQALFVLAKTYEKPVTVEMQTLWSKVLADLTPSELEAAVVSYVRSDEKYFPRPGQIYQLARPKVNPEHEAAVTADIIFSCVRSYGTDTEGERRARAKIGDKGWAYIVNQGGWETFSRSIKSEEEVPILKAQCRKSLMGSAERFDRPAPQPTARVSLESLGVQLKKLEGKL